jgi:hypothetical protein
MLRYISKIHNFKEVLTWSDNSFIYNICFHLRNDQIACYYIKKYEAEISEEQIVIILIYRGVAVGRSQREEKRLENWLGQEFV